MMQVFLRAILLDTCFFSVLFFLLDHGITDTSSILLILFKKMDTDVLIIEALLPDYYTDCQLRHYCVEFWPDI